MILFNGLLGLLALPFVVLAIGVWMCYIILKIALIGIVALGCVVVGLVRGITARRQAVGAHRKGA